MFPLIPTVLNRDYVYPPPLSALLRTVGIRGNIPTQLERKGGVETWGFWSSGF